MKAGKEAGAYGRQVESSEDEAKLRRMESEACSLGYPELA